MWLMPKSCRELARAPVRRTVRRLTLDRPLQNPRLQRRRQRARLLPRVSAEQPRQSLRHKALAPPIDKAVRAVQLVADRCPRVPGVEQQNQPRPARLIGAAATDGWRVASVPLASIFDSTIVLLMNTTILAFQLLQATSRGSVLTNYDAIVVGAGHNGLTNAAYLARAGSRSSCSSATRRSAAPRSAASCTRAGSTRTAPTSAACCGRRSSATSSSRTARAAGRAVRRRRHLHAQRRHPRQLHGPRRAAPRDSRATTRATPTPTSAIRPTSCASAASSGRCCCARRPTRPRSRRATSASCSSSARSSRSSASRSSTTRSASTR